MFRVATLRLPLRNGRQGRCVCFDDDASQICVLVSLPCLVEWYTQQVESEPKAGWRHEGMILYRGGRCISALDPPRKRSLRACGYVSLKVVNPFLWRCAELVEVCVCAWCAELVVVCVWLEWSNSAQTSCLRWRPTVAWPDGWTYTHLRTRLLQTGEAEF